MSDSQLVRTQTVVKSVSITKLRNKLMTKNNWAIVRINSELKITERNEVLHTLPLSTGMRCYSFLHFSYSWGPSSLAVSMVHVVALWLGLLIRMGHQNSGKHELDGPQCVTLIWLQRHGFGWDWKLGCWEKGPQFLLKMILQLEYRLLNYFPVKYIFSLLCTLAFFSMCSSPGLNT